MLTPAEELGLSGLNLDSRLRKVFYSLADAEIVALTNRMTAEALRRNLIYTRHGQIEAIRVMLRPIAVLPDQLAYLHYVSQTIMGALKRVAELYLNDPAVREVVPLAAAEEAWLRESWGESQHQANPVFGRLDAMAEFTSPTWKESLKFFEPNLCGVGGIHLGPTCARMLAEVVLPVLESRDPELQFQLGQDLRELFIQEVVDHLEAIGRPGRNLCFIEPKYADEGTSEQAPLAEYFHERHGMTVVHADPKELAIRGGEVWYEDTPIDIAYRDYEIRDLLELEAGGVDIGPVRRLFRENRMISSMAGDFDHKSCWELLTERRFAERYFSSDERQVFRRHVLWTRLLADRQTTLPHGELGSLVDYARREHERLVLKPNRSYGGDRVYVGLGMDAAEWNALVDAALAGPDAWVVQRLASIPASEFPVVSADGAVRVEPFHTVMGFAPTRYGLGIVGRASQKQVVNVAQRGGMCGVLIGRSPRRLVGPAEPAKGG
ncbi:MAG TPA: hypothetical protein VMV10_14570 [Pirellulales bacterium]|nr:hypothetical protein [Pirellulales bacterium]